MPKVVKETRKKTERKPIDEEENFKEKQAQISQGSSEKQGLSSLDNPDRQGFGRGG